MDNRHNHPLEQEMQKKKNAILRRLICALILVAGITATFLTFSRPALAQSATSLGPDAITPCHDPGHEASSEFANDTIDVFSPNGSPVGTIDVQFWFCYDYQSAFVRSVYHESDNSTQDLQIETALQGFYQDTNLDNIVGNADLGNTQSFDTPVILATYGPQESWSAAVAVTSGFYCTSFVTTAGNSVCQTRSFTPPPTPTLPVPPSNP